MEFKYEVAFSFLEQDEGLILKLYEHIRDRLTCFIYSLKQEELITEDGIEKFTDVFSKDSRVVVLLYRENYGKTRWTKIEETAIKNRGLNNGFGFLILIPYDEKIRIPKWYPEQFIWGNLKHTGVEELSQLIINKVKTSGGEININALIAKAERIKRSMDHTEKLKHHLNTQQALLDCNAELLSLFQFINDLADDILTKKLGLDYEISKGTSLLKITLQDYVFQFLFDRVANNVIGSGKLEVKFFKKEYIDDPYPQEKFNTVLSKSYQFTRDIDWNVFWKDITNNEIYISHFLAEHYFYKLLDYLEKGDPSDSSFKFIVV
jgi:hypothetical protein